MKKSRSLTCTPEGPASDLQETHTLHYNCSGHVIIVVNQVCLNSAAYITTTSKLIPLSNHEMACTRVSHACYDMNANFRSQMCISLFPVHSGDTTGFSAVSCRVTNVYWCWRHDPIRREEVAGQLWACCKGFNMLKLVFRRELVARVWLLHTWCVQLLAVQPL